MSDLVIRQDTDGLVTLVLNRPEKLNALTHETFKALSDHFDAIVASTDKVGCVVLRGAGRSFCAGNDLDAPAGPDNARSFNSKTVEKLGNLPQPTIAVIHGHCYTGGLELALGCDILIAGESAKFADTHGRWDMVPIWGLSQRLPRRIGAAKAKEMSFTSRVYSGREAEAMGLVNTCVPDAELDATLASFTTPILENSWRSHRENKKLIQATDGMGLTAGLAYEFRHAPGRGAEMAQRLEKFRKK